MRDKNIPMVENRKSQLPTVYGDTPSFLGVPVLDLNRLPRGCDVVVAGVPWEGAVTWGSYSGCELAPRSIRHASARYGGFLPEYAIDLFDHLSVGDVGDISVNPTRPRETMAGVLAMARAVYTSGAIPFTLGGDHSFTPEIVEALSEHRSGQIGIIHFDAHFDNSKEFGKDPVPRCGPIYRISQLGGVRTGSIVQIGIRGPRNSRAQYDFAKDIGATVFDMKQVRRMGMDAVTAEAIRIARKGTVGVYVTICSDCLDAAYNSGGPIDFNGLQPHELFDALFTLGAQGIDGLDYVEVYPLSDPRSVSSHLAAWAMIHAMAGLAARKGRLAGAAPGAGKAKSGRAPAKS